MLDRLQAAAASLENSTFLQPSLGGTSIHSSRSKNNRISRISGMTSSSSATSSTSNAANREKRSLQNNLKNFAVHNNSGGDESDRSLHSEPPPEPAPPEIPPRTQSLLMSLRKKSDYQLKFEDNGDQKHEQFIPASQIGKLFPCFFTSFIVDVGLASNNHFTQQNPFIHFHQHKLQFNKNFLI